MILFDAGYDTGGSSPAGTPLTHPRIGYQTWTLDLDVSAASASSSSEDGPADAPLRANTDEFWEPTSLPATWTVDLGENRAIDYVGIAAHTLGSSGCTLQVHTSDGTVAGSPISSQVWEEFVSDIAEPEDDAPLLFLDTMRSHRYARLTITGGLVMPKIGVVYAGEALVMPHRIFGGHTPINLSRITVLNRSLSRGGQLLGQSFRRHGVATSASFRHLTSDWYRAYFDPFVKAARQYPFFWAWRPADFTGEVGFGWSTEDIKPSNMGLRDFMQVALEIRGLGHE